MQAHELRSPRGSRKRKIIVGRGNGSGHGKTSRRGQTGQKSRSGRGILGVLEGGQMPLIRRLPKVGFRSHRPLIYEVVKLQDLSRFKAGTVVDARTLKEAGCIKNVFRPYKVLGNGEIDRALTVKAYCFSKSAEAKILKVGGKTIKIDQSYIKKEIGTKDQDS